MLAALVASGDLPPVDDRLPDNPYVAHPANTGKYGGTIRLSHSAPPGSFSFISRGSLAFLEEDMISPRPGLLEGWNFSDDFRILTVQLREGTKWSDGMPFTTADIAFTYDDVIMDADFFPETLAFWKGSSMDVIDDATVRLTFPDPKPHFFQVYGVRNQYLQDSRQRPFYFPRHHAEQFHPAYNDNAEAAAKAAGFDSWILYFYDRAAHPEHSPGTAETPTVDPWMTTEVTQDRVVAERNPYFWGVDADNNQLPYIDRLVSLLVTDFELRRAKALAGEVDWASLSQTMSMDLVADLRARSDSNNMHVWTASSLHPNKYNVMPNQNHRDARKRELFQDQRFRQAVSLALNRDELNEIIYLGLGIVQQSVPVPASGGFYWPELANMHLEFDPARANELLDEVGLSNKSAQGFRTWADGSDLKLTINVVHEFEPDWQKFAPLVANYLKAVGLDTEIELMTYALYKENLVNGSADIVGWSQAGEVATSQLGGNIPHTSWIAWLGYANAWSTWHSSGGAEGEEPPQWFQDSRALASQAATLPLEEAIEKLREAHVAPISNYSVIGTVGGFPVPHARNAGLMNLQEEIPHDVDDYGYLLFAEPFTWYYQ